jgi:hypothetical protein
VTVLVNVAIARTVPKATLDAVELKGFILERVFVDFMS